MKSRAARPAKKASKPARVLYLYAISRLPKNVVPTISAEGIDGAAPIEALRCDPFLCWISRVPENEFADTTARPHAGPGMAGHGGSAASACGSRNLRVR